MIAAKEISLPLDMIKEEYDAEIDSDEEPEEIGVSATTFSSTDSVEESPK